MIRPGTGIATLAVAPVLMVGGLLGVWLVTEGDTAAPEKAQGAVCVPTAVWSANDAERPCARIVRVWEDGSARVRVTQADGTYQFTANTGARSR